VFQRRPAAPLLPSGREKRHQLFPDDTTSPQINFSIPPQSLTDLHTADSQINDPVHKKIDFFWRFLLNCPLVVNIVWITKLSLWACILISTLLHCFSFLC
jgi:hypothetical protein